MALVVASVAWALSAAVPQKAAGQESSLLTSGAVTPEAPEVVSATRIIGAPPELDGRIDEPVWAEAQVIRGFTQREPVEGVPAADDTEVRIVYTADAIYIGARMYGDPTTIRRDVARRDVESPAEQFIVSLDTYHDGRTAYSFAVTASGGRLDYHHAADNQGNRDYTFDPVWEAAAHVDAEGWAAEMRIPFTQLRFSPAEEQVWGANFVRRRPALQEESMWRLVRRDETGWASRMGELRLVGVRATGRLEFQPYLTSRGTLASVTDPDDPFSDPRELSMGIGGDFKAGLGPNLTLDVTVNPDFGQVEADPAVVNLSAFEVFFDERRPFFTEGLQLFEFGNFFYSRRIGAQPQGQASADYVEGPENTTILGAAKLTGRLPSGLSLGVLAALTDQEKVRTFDTAANRFGETVVEPMTLYAASRVQQQFGADGSTVGGFVGVVRRDVGELPALSELLVETALSGGVDGRYRWNGGMYDVNWQIAGTHVRGSEAAILRQQRSSRRYFQRPDADYVEVDPARTALTGYNVTVGHSKLSGAHWLWDIDLWAESPGLEPNDLGRLSSTDGIGGFGGISYRETVPGRFFRAYTIRLMTEQEWIYDGTRVSAWHGLFLSATFNNFWYVEGGFDYHPRVLNHTLTRGGPLMRRGGFRGPWMAIVSPDGGDWRISFRAGGGDIPARGWLFWANPTFTYRPNPRLEMSLTPEYRRGVEPFQYVATFDGGSPATYGGRYVFGRVEFNEVSAQLRANLAIAPDLTLETYFEPFASAGDFTEFGELAAARTYRLREYGTDGTTLERREDGHYHVTDGVQTFSFRDPTFHIRSFRSNAVLRWEWRPGSTLLLVWQQNRSGNGTIGELARPGDLWRSMRAEGVNYLAIKATYWLPL